MPKEYNDWMKDNAERIANAKSLPYFIKDNPEVASQATGLDIANIIKQPEKQNHLVNLLHKN